MKGKKEFRLLAYTLCMAIIIGLFTMSADTSYAATTYYVSPGGNDATGNGSAASPWKSLSHACSQVTSYGDTIYVNAGTYTDYGQCILSRGVKIEGARNTAVTINTTADPYIRAVSPLPVVDGSNWISGIRFVGPAIDPLNPQTICIKSEGRSNQKIFNCRIENYARSVDICGKYQQPVWNLKHFQDSYNSIPQSAMYFDYAQNDTIPPDETDWALNIQVHDNTIIKGNLLLHVIKGADIYNNYIDNSSIAKSAVGDDAFFWSGVQFHDNTILMNMNGWDYIACEVWCISDNTRFYNNWTDGWFSIIKNPCGGKEPYSWQITNNVFASDVALDPEDPVRVALETCYHTENVLIEGNYIANTGANKPYYNGIGLWGYDELKNITIRNNVIYNMAGNGIRIETKDTQADLIDADNIYIYNNIIDGTASDGDGVSIWEGAGDVDNIYVKNNIFMYCRYGMSVCGENYSQHSVSGVEFTNNVIYNASEGTHRDYQTGAFSLVADNHTFSPEINWSGSRPDPYYRPSGSGSNLVDAGVNVGLPYSGSAPDIGAYEYGIDPTPDPGTEIILNDRMTGSGNNQFEFNGVWNQGLNAESYLGDNTWSGTANDYYQVRFYGTQAKLYSEVWTNMGIIAVSVDGGSETLVDQYSPSRIHQHLVYSSPVLSPGQHTLKVRVTGTKSANSSNYYHVADKVVIYDDSGSPEPTPPPVRNKLSGELFGTEGSWSPPGDTYDKAYDSNTATFFDSTTADYAYTGMDLGEGGEMRVSGIRFYPRSNWAGRMAGGKFQGSNTSRTSGYVDLYTVPSTPSAGWNEVTVSDTDRYRYLRYVAPAGGYGNVAEVEFLSGDIIVNDRTTGTDNSRYEFVGTWNQGINADSYLGDNTWSGTANAYYQVRFYGTQIELYSEVWTNMGIIAVSVDAGSETLIDQYSPERIHCRLIFTSPVLSLDQHTLKVRVAGTKNANSSNYYHVADKVYIKTN